MIFSLLIVIDRGIPNDPLYFKKRKQAESYFKKKIEKLYKMVFATFEEAWAYQEEYPDEYIEFHYYPRVVLKKEFKDAESLL